MARAQIEYVAISCAAAVARECTHSFEKSDPADRRQHSPLRLHQPGADRSREHDPGRSRPGRRGATLGMTRGALRPHRDDVRRRRSAPTCIADNKLALNAGWDEEILAERAQSPARERHRLRCRTDGLLDRRDRQSRSTGSPPRSLAIPRTTSCRTTDRRFAGRATSGQLGPHRLICGDALDPDTVAALMNGRAGANGVHGPALQCPDPGSCRRRGAIKHREFAMASGEMTKAEFTGFLRAAFPNLVRHTQ